MYIRSQISPHNCHHLTRITSKPASGLRNLQQKCQHLYPSHQQAAPTQKVPSVQILTEVVSRGLIQANWKNQPVERTGSRCQKKSTNRDEGEAAGSNPSWWTGSVKATGLDNVVKTRQKFLFKSYIVRFFLLPSVQTVFSNLNTQKQADFQQPVKRVLWKTSMAADHLLTKDYYTPTAQLQLPAKIYKEYE